MQLFKTSREKRLWSYAFLVILAIALSLLLDRPLGHFFRDPNFHELFFMVGFFGVLASILLYGLLKKATSKEWVIWLGMFSVYSLLVFRLSATERSHLLEYSILAVFIHLALLERYGEEQNRFQTAFYAFVITAMVGVLDECLQLFMPSRVFDTNDIVFNCLAALLSIGGSQLLIQLRMKAKDINFK